MATEVKHQELTVLVCSAKEIVDLIGLLAAQLGDVPLSGNHAGACPTISITEGGRLVKRLTFVLEQDQPEIR